MSVDGKSPWESELTAHPPFQTVDQEVFQTMEGQLAVDVCETEHAIIIRAAIAGVEADEVEVHVSNDMVTIRGVRSHEADELGTTYHFRECFWGGFSRSIILPAPIYQDETQAVFRQGVLTLTLPKATSESRIPIRFES